MLNVIAGQLSEGTVPTTNSYESISTVTVGAGGSSTITFSSIPSTYKHLQIRSMSAASSGSPYVLLTFNSDSTAANYADHYLLGDGGNTAAGSDVNTLSGIGFLNQRTTVGAGVTDILDYANNNKYKTMRSLNGGDANGSGQIILCSGLWKSISAINSITLTTSSSSFAQYSQFALYGIKG